MISVTDSATVMATEQLARTARAAEAAGDLDRALGFFRGLAEIESDNPVWAFEAVRVLRRCGRGAEAAEALKKAMRKWPRAASLPEIQALVPEVAPSDEQHRGALGADCPPDEALKRPLIADDGSQDFILGKGGRKAAVLVFTGLADRIIMPLPLFDRYLAELDLTAIYLRDRKRVGFLKGIKSLGDDYDASVERLRNVLDAMGVETVYTIGNSAGGMGAISFGIDLGAAKVLAFSSPVATTRRAAELDRRSAIFAERVLSDIPESRRDLEGRIKALDGASQFHLYYGSDMPEDRYHAESLKGVKGVTLHPLHGLGGHGALFRIAAEQGLRPLFASMFDEARGR